MAITKPVFKRFNDLRWPDINCDLHMHTTRTDGKATIAAVLDTASARGLARVAFTEHVRADSAWFPEFAAEVRAARAQQPDLTVFVGCEAKANDSKGWLDASNMILSECDIVLGSVHRFPDGAGGFVDWSKLSPAEFAAMEFDLALGLVQTAPIDVLAHPGGMYSRRHGDFPADRMRALMQATLARGIAIEINASYTRDFAAFLDLCAAENPLVSIGSDMHRLEDLGKCRDQLRQHGIGVT